MHSNINVFDQINAYDPDNICIQFQTYKYGIIESSGLVCIL